jgi:Ser/Thr protein kinase RdoA (MazF antagonist)
MTAPEMGGRSVGSFEALSPGDAVRAVERAFAFVLDGTIDSYPSYVNRVYGMRREDGEALVVKFYRPGRWSRAAILDEHRFLRDLADAEIPVIAPLPGADGGTLQEIEIVGDGADGSPADGGAGDGAVDTAAHADVAADADAAAARFPFAVFPKAGGRTFEPESDDDLVRLGSLVGRCHAVGAAGIAPDRAVCEPTGLTDSFVDELLGKQLVHPDCRDDFERIARRTVVEIAPLFAGVRFSRIHGDCHRGNLIDRPGRGLALIDFDDMMTGPAVQDVWLVLPGYAADCRRELDLVLEGFERFSAFDRNTLRLIEPLRFMRMIYFLAWRARQRNDYWFRGSFPDWGTEAFWIKETEDLRVQSEVIRSALEE